VCGLTAHVLGADFGSAVDEQLNDVETARLDRLHDGRGARQRRRLERSAVLQQVLDYGAHARVGGHVQRRPVEVVDGVHVRTASVQPRYQRDSQRAADRSPHGPESGKKSDQTSEERGKPSEQKIKIRIN